MRRPPRVVMATLSLVALVVLTSCAGDATKAHEPTSPLAASTQAVTWDLVALGDSNVAGWAVRSDEPYTPEEAFPGVYADLLGKVQGVTVVLHSYFPSQDDNEIRTVAEWNDVLATDRQMRADLAAAEVVIVWIGYHNVIPVLMFGECGLSWPDPLKGCLRAATRTMPQDYDRLFGTIEQLVPSGTPMLVGDYGIPAPLFDQWSWEPFWPQLKRAMFEEWRDALEAAAEAHGATVVHTYAALNGPTGDEAPGRDLTSDGWHFNSEGHRFIAETFLAEDGISP